MKLFAFASSLLLVCGLASTAEAQINWRLIALDANTGSKVYGNVIRRNGPNVVVEIVRNKDSDFIIMDVINCVSYQAKARGPWMGAKPGTVLGKIVDWSCES